MRLVCTSFSISVLSNCTCSPLKQATLSPTLRLLFYEVHEMHKFKVVEGRQSNCIFSEISV